jgi:hypothetical protein
MAKASFKLANGTEIHIDGECGELEKLLRVFASEGKLHSEEGKSAKRPPKGNKSTNTSRSKKGPMTYVMQLNEKKFFSKKKRSLDDVRQELNTSGHFYPSEALGVTLLRLVKKGALRRIKENKKWLYTTSD